MFRKAWMNLGRTMGNQLAAGAVVAAAILVICGFLFYLFERGSNPAINGVGSGYFWLTLTLLTAGTPFGITTPAGNVIYYFVLMSGLGFVAMVTGAIASKLVEFVLRRSSGMGEARVSEHIVICGWSSKGDEILRELHAEEVDDKRPVVILAALDTNPTQDELTTFVAGSPSSANDLLRAGIDRATTAIVLADDSNPNASSDDRDAKTLLTTLAIESVAPKCYTCVEVLRSDNRQHFERTRADELVVSDEVTGSLLASSAVIHGLTRAVSDLLTHPVGNELYTMTATAEMGGKNFNLVMIELKESRDCVLVGVAEAGQPNFEINPKGDRVVNTGERLLLIARTGFSEKN